MSLSLRHPLPAFTVMELLVAILVLALAAVITLPYLQHYALAARLEMAAQSLTVHLMQARLLATSRNSRYRVGFDVSANRYYYQVDINNSGRIDASERSRRLYYLPAGVYFNSDGVLGPPSDPRRPPRSPVTFTHGLMSVGPSGRWSNPGTIYLANDIEDRLAISVTIAGRIRIWRWDRDSHRWK